MKKIELLPSDNDSRTYDFITYVSFREERGENGMKTGFVTAYSLEPSGQEKQLLKTTGENAGLSFVTDNYTGLHCIDSEDDYIAIVPLQ